MFHPLLGDPSLMKDTELDAKIQDLNKKYHMAARLGQGGACQQIALALDVYRADQSRRQNEAMQTMIKKQNKGLDDLINVD
jgi:hypothetical protein